MPHSIGGLSSLTKDGTCTPGVEAWGLNHWVAREVPPYFYFLELFLVSWLPLPSCPCFCFALFLNGILFLFHFLYFHTSLRALILMLDIFLYFHHYRLPLNSFCLYLHLWSFINGRLFIFKSEALKCPFCEWREYIGPLSSAVVSSFGVGRWKVPSNVLIYRYFLLGWLVS